MLNKRYIKLIKRDIFVLISFPVFLFQFLFCYILEKKEQKRFKRDIIVLISFLILFVSISFLVNIGKEMSLPGFRITVLCYGSFVASCYVFFMGHKYCETGTKNRAKLNGTFKIIIHF